ncbi:hypothetical protein OJAV_G00086780 [Oryzias javanicus]|uniref:DH domain-containing protein n=1 Tax=Oryzias javanicus TaxID=123683 RepID=A0A3S2MVQ4_ORYJA|nr:hypothetical protein OJAV_G00086780 [Oryzias javanicus]
MQFMKRQGEAKVFALLEGLDSVPEDVEVFIVLEGSTLVHVARAQSDVMLSFIVPGHNLPEMVSVQAYLCSDNMPLTWAGASSLEYVYDDAQELAEHLVVHGHCLSSTDCKELSSLFGLSQEGSRRAVDRRVALAMANLDFPSKWNVLGTHSGNADGSPRESPLHLAVRWGLHRLAELLLCQPGGLMAANLPNEEGVTPLQLAQRAGDTDLLKLLLEPPNPLATPPAGLSQVWVDQSRLLRFCHDTGNLTLTARQNPRWNAQQSWRAHILILRDRLRDMDFLKEIKALRRERPKIDFGKEELVDDPEDSEVYSGINGEKEDNLPSFYCGDIEEPLMFCLNEEDEEDDPSQSDSEKSPSIRESQASSPTLAAVARLSAMMHGQDRVYANAMLVDQVEDADIRYRPPRKEDVPSHAGLSCWNSFPTSAFDSESCSQNPYPPSPDDQEPRESRAPRIPSLECDSADEDILGHSYPCSSLKHRPILRSSSGEDRGSFDASPDFNRSHSDITPKTTKNSEDPEVRLRSYSYSSPKAKPSRPLLNRDSAITDLEEEQRALNLTETPREKRIEDEEWDKYIIPSKVETEKYKVSRTFSFLKNRMSSTRNKTKVKGKDMKEGKEKSGAANGHQFVPVSQPAPALCVACDKPVSGKELVQCSSCFINVHKNCRESVAACGKKLQPDRNAALVKSKTTSLPHNSVKENSVFSSSSSSPSSMSTREKRETVGHFSKSLSMSLDSSRGLSDVAEADSEGSMAAFLSSSLSEEGSQVTSPSTDLPISTQDTVDAPVLSELSADQLGLDAESWSLAVTPDFCRKLDRRTIKRQDVIYELMQTELHHIQTLTVMSEVFRRGMLEELQLDLDCVARIFPCLDPLLLFHRNLFRTLQERRHVSSHPENSQNYLIHQIGDILLQQFSDENAEKMKQLYGEFCSHHIEAVNVFKELQQQNKKLQNFVRQQSNNSLVRRREVPEFILLVTQRITKYPVLLERILQHTQEESQEHLDLSKALAQIRDIIAAVDLTVNKYEKCQELQEVLARLDIKSFAKLKNGKVFRKQDLHSKHRNLQHKGLVFWKTATGRLKDTLALLLTDVLVFLQEKDQRFIFASVDQKPPVIPLQKLIVHTTTREERNAWMRHIRQAVESCPEEEEEEERNTETEEARQAAEVRIQKINKFQDALFGQDQRICHSLEEKLQLYAELAELTLPPPEAAPHRLLLVQPAQLNDGETPRQASSLLTAALREAENLINVLQTRNGFSTQSQSSPVGDGCSYNSVQESPSEPDYLSTLSMSSTSLGSDSESAGLETVSWSPASEFRKGDKGTLLKVAESVQNLTQLLYSLQAAVTFQDSCYEVSKLLLLEGEKHQPRNVASHQNSLEGRQKNIDKMKEEKKSIERKKEEVDEVQKLHIKLRQEQLRWDKECLAREKQQSEQEVVLEQREQQCFLETERLRCEREQLEAQLLEYQQNLDRLKEGQRSVELEKKKIETQQRLLQSWRHSRQSSLPVTIPLDGYKMCAHSRTGSLDGSCSVYKNEAALLASLQQNHLPTNNNQHQHALLMQRRNQDGPPHSSSYPSSSSLSASLYNSLNTLLSQAHSKQPPDSSPRPPAEPLHPFSSRASTQPRNDLHLQQDAQPPNPWRSEVTGLFKDDFFSPAPHLQPPAYLSLEGQIGDEVEEENVVYL